MGLTADNVGVGRIPIDGKYHYVCSSSLVTTGSSGLTNVAYLTNAGGGGSTVDMKIAGIQLYQPGQSSGYYSTGAVPLQTAQYTTSPNFAQNGEAITPSSIVINGGSNIVYTCSGGTSGGELVYGTAGQSLCTTAGGTATATNLTVD